MLREYLSVWRRLGDFRGRSSRKQYGSFFFFTCLINFILGFLISMFLYDSHGYEIAEVSIILYYLYNIAALVPGISVAVRRAHDTNRRWYYILIPVYGFILMFFKGDPYANAFGVVPDGETYGNAKGVHVENNRASRICPHCGRTIEVASGYCGFCGNPIVPEQPVRSCANCGSPLKEGASFCTNCGMRTQQRKVEKKVCPHCFRQYPPETLFCENCGAMLREEI